MSRKDFILIAETILALNVDRATREHIAEGFARTLATQNGAFKWDLFIQAATGIVPVNARKARV